MPTNLPPEYYDADERYRAAQTPAEKVVALEALISTIPKHKGTDHMRADLRKQLSKLKSAAQSKKGASTQISPFYIDREGAGQIVVVGAANAGKSALVQALTNAEPEVSEAPFSTWTPTPGMMPVENIQVQLIDTPAINREYIEPQFVDLIRRADLVWLVVNLQTYPIDQLESALKVLKENRIVPLGKTSGERTDGQRVWEVPILVLANKCDDEECDEIYDMFLALLEEEWSVLPISALNQRNFERLKQIVFERLNVIRVYSKAPGKEPDHSRPFVLPKGSDVQDFAAKVHQDFVKNLKTARVWGSSAFDGQMVQRDYELQDGDVVELKI
jgi:ribosome-interacting GTPase 1